uniref:Uncharacterized protein n=1 Tax=Strigamia maritima TaxID=126957 RepID=T1JBY6_STRMM
MIFQMNIASFHDNSSTARLRYLNLDSWDVCTSWRRIIWIIVRLHGFQAREINYWKNTKKNRSLNYLEKNSTI